MTFGAALDALEADDVIRSALPGDMYRVFMHYKRDEWERYCAGQRLGRHRVPRRAALEASAKCAELQGSSTATAPTRSGAT